MMLQYASILSYWGLLNILAFRIGYFVQYRRWWECVHNLWISHRDSSSLSELTVHSRGTAQKTQFAIECTGRMLLDIRNWIENLQALMYKWAIYSNYYKHKSIKKALTCIAKKEQCPDEIPCFKHCNLSQRYSPWRIDAVGQLMSTLKYIFVFQLCWY